MKRRITAVRLLARIDRKLALLVAERRGEGGGILTIAQAATAGVSPTTTRRAVRQPDGPDKLPASDLSLGRIRPR